MHRLPPETTVFTEHPTLKQFSVTVTIGNFTLDGVVTVDNEDNGDMIQHITLEYPKLDLTLTHSRKINIDGHLFGDMHIILGEAISLLAPKIVALLEASEA